jgi:hypothetical protein
MKLTVQTKGVNAPAARDRQARDRDTCRQVNSTGPLGATVIQSEARTHTRSAMSASPAAPPGNIENKRCIARSIEVPDRFSRGPKEMCQRGSYEGGIGVQDPVKLSCERLA